MGELKPICVIYFPYLFYPESGARNWIYEYARFLNGDDHEKKWDSKCDYSQYYWFCFYKSNITEPEFKVFYEKEFNQVKFEELKQMVNDAIGQQKIKNQ